MSDLRNKTIRLAHANPALRPHLLSVLKEARTTLRVQDIINIFKDQVPSDAAATLKKVMTRAQSEGDRASALEAWNVVMHSGYKQYMDAFKKLRHPLVLQGMRGKPRRDVSFQPKPPGWVITKAETDEYSGGGGGGYWKVTLKNIYTDEETTDSEPLDTGRDEILSLRDPEIEKNGEVYIETVIGPHYRDDDDTGYDRHREGNVSILSTKLRFDYNTGNLIDTDEDTSQAPY